MYPVWTRSDPKNFHYGHFIILIAVSVQIFPLIIFPDSKEISESGGPFERKVLIHYSYFGPI